MDRIGLLSLFVYFDTNHLAQDRPLSPLLTWLFYTTYDWVLNLGILNKSDNTVRIYFVENYNFKIKNRNGLFEDDINSCFKLQTLWRMRRWRHYRISPIVIMNFKWPNCYYRIYSCEIHGHFIVSKCPRIDLSGPIYGAKTDFSPVIWHRFRYFNRYLKSNTSKSTIIPFCIDLGELVAGGVAVERPFGVKICSFSSMSFEMRIEIFSISD